MSNAANTKFFLRTPTQTYALDAEPTTENRLVFESLGYEIVDRASAEADWAKDTFTGPKSTARLLTNRVMHREAKGWR